MSPYSIDLVSNVQIILLDDEQRPISEALVNLEEKTIKELFTFDELSTPAGEIPLDTTGLKQFTENICKKIIS